MRILVLRALECHHVQDSSPGVPDRVRLEITPDIGPRIVRERTMMDFQRWRLELEIPFEERVTLRLYEVDQIEDDDLGEHVLDATLVPRDRLRFDDDGVHYELWIEVLDPARRHRLQAPLSLRDMLGRAGEGQLPAGVQRSLMGVTPDLRGTPDILYRCAEEISLRDLRARHAAQDQGRDDPSVRRWIERHCKRWGEDSVIPLDQVPRGRAWYEVVARGNWEPVVDEVSRFVSGLQRTSRRTNEDNPLAHETMDWNMDLVPDPAFSYMVSSTCKSSGQAVPGKHIEVPQLHNEQETGSFPLAWRPFWGEYVTFRGRWVYDRGHFPMTTEIHPVNAIIKERTTAAAIGRGGTFVPVNRVRLGMGMSGGFPSFTGERWNELDLPQVDLGALGQFGGTILNAWATDLRAEPMTFKVFPPVSRPPGASLTWRSRAEVIRGSWAQAQNFLMLCQQEQPRGDGGLRGFRDWSIARARPEGFAPQVAPSALQPTIEDRGTHLLVTVDLSAAEDFIFGYQLDIDCGWTERGDHLITSYEVVFDELEVTTFSGTPGRDAEWHVYYGVNGQWWGWFHPDVSMGRYPVGQRFEVACVDDMPLLLLDTGIHWRGRDWGNDRLDEVRLRLRGDDAVPRRTSSSRISNVQEFSPPGGGQGARFQLRSAVDSASDYPAGHRWHMTITGKVE